MERNTSAAGAEWCPASTKETSVRQSPPFINKDEAEDCVAMATRLSYHSSFFSVKIYVAMRIFHR